MSAGLLKRLRLSKIDAIIVVILVVIAGYVLSQSEYVSPAIEQVVSPKTEKQEIPEIEPEPELPIPPESLTAGYMRGVSPEDEGLHYDKLSVCREWWYYSVIFNEDSELAGWTATISFNHMARTDLLGTSKPDLFVFTLHGPDGEEYGGLINKERGFGILKQPTLQAKTPGVGVSFDDSWAEGSAPEWFVHAEDNEIDKNNEIILDLSFFAPNDPIWTIGDKALTKNTQNLASYVFLGCNVSGTVQINGKEYTVEGIGQHEHTWSPNVVTKVLVNGWDWAYVQLDNGWTLYYSTYYPTPQYISTKTTNVNPLSSFILTTDQGKTITSLQDVDPEILESDDEIFTFVKMPLEIEINGKPGALQPLLGTYDIIMDVNLQVDNTVENVWKFPTYVGMNVGRSLVSGSVTWTDEDGDQEVEFSGIASTWSMRAFL
jgi:predicted secreted hydrolase